MSGGGYGGGGQFPQYGGSTMNYGQNPSMGGYNPMRGSQMRPMPTQGAMQMPETSLHSSAPPQGMGSMMNRYGQGGGGYGDMGGAFSRFQSGMLGGGPTEMRQGMQIPEMSTPHSFVRPQPTMPTQQTQAAQAPQQSFDDFSRTLAPGSMSMGQMQDLYAAKQKASGPAFPEGWKRGDTSFDPQGMAGKTVTQDNAWYYGQDAVGRPINNAGDAYAQFNPAAGGGRNRPWFA